MNDAILIKDARAVAGMTPPRSKAAFNQANLVVRGASTLLRARAYTTDERVVGPKLSDDELQQLIDSGHAIALGESVPLVSGAILWVLRRGLPRRDRTLQDLRAGGLLVHPPIPGPEDSWLCVVDQRAPRASDLRDRWRTEALNEAKIHATQRDWTLAEAEAQVAFALARGLEPEVTALLSLAHEQCGRGARASGVLAMASNSRGAEFRAEVEAQLERLRSELDAKAPARRRTSAELRALLAERFPTSIKRYGKPRSARLDAA